MFGVDERRLGTSVSTTPPPLFYDPLNLRMHLVVRRNISWRSQFGADVDHHAGDLAYLMFMLFACAGIVAPDSLLIASD